MNFFKKNNILQQSLLPESIVEPQENTLFLSSNYLFILDETSFINYLKKLKNTNIFAFNLVTDSLDILHAQIVGIAFAIMPFEAVYIPFSNLTMLGKLKRNTVIQQLKPILEDIKITKIGLNAKFNSAILKRYDIELNGIKFDIMLESYCLNSIYRKHDIYSLASLWLNHKTFLLKKDKKNKQFYDYNSIKKDAYYEANNVDLILRLHLKIWSKLKKEAGPKRVFEHIEIPLMKVISRIESNGVLIDQKILIQHSQELATRLTKLQKQAHELAGENFNLSSTRQVQIILFKKQGIQSLKKTPTGVLSTNEEVLVELGCNYLLPNIILEYRRLLKLKSTYTDKLPLMINSVTSRIHTSYHQVATATGRLSSTEPNLQNIPVRDEEGRRIRKAFIAAPDYLIVSADYSQIELRIMAHLSQDKGLLDAFILKEDIHCTTASEVFGVHSDKVSNDQRRSAKTINFGLIYGMSAYGLSRQLHISIDQAKKYMDLYFKRYPCVLLYMEKMRKKAIKHGYVETLDGRRLWLPGIKSSSKSHLKIAERAAINAPLQGTAADIIKRAMIAIDNFLIHQRYTDKVKMVMQVHDELVFEIHQDFVERACKIIRHLMENIIKLDVKLQVKIGIGDNWEQAH